MLINELAKISGISQRTLRYYDEIGLLSPTRFQENSYREYSEQDVNILQQILFYRELKFSLVDIKKMMHAKEYDIRQALHQQHQLLVDRRQYLDNLIDTVAKTIQAMEGGANMTNEEKFDVFKNKIIADNEQQYGEEIRANYGEESIMASYGKLKNLSEEKFEAMQQLEQQLFERMREAMASGDDGSELMMEVAELHKRWLCFSWEKYTKNAHNGLAKLYLIDERFTAYYDERVGEGATKFLHDAIEIYTE